MAAQISVRDDRLELALAYLQNGWTDEAVRTLDLQEISADDVERSGDVAGAVVLLQIRLAADRLDGLADAAGRLARIHPDVADFHVVLSQCAAEVRDQRAALDALTELQHAGLPLLQISFAHALRSLERAARVDYAPGSDPKALAAVHRRLQAVAPHVDPASRILAFRGAAPDVPSSELSLARRAALPFERWLATKYKITVRPRAEEEKRTMTVDVQTTPASRTAEGEPNAGSTSAGAGSTTTTSTLTTVAKWVAVVALLAWAAFVVYLLANVDEAEITWSRAIFVFASVEAVAFAAAGALFGTTVTRQRAERAEQQADENKKAAEGGKALAAALKAEEPSVVHEDRGAEGGPRPLGPSGQSGELAAREIATRHARLARQLFP